MKKLLVTRVAMSTHTIPYNTDFYEDRTEEQAAQFEKDLDVEEWAEFFFERNVQWVTSVRMIEEED